MSIHKGHNDIMASSAQHQAGVGMVEILVTLFILSVGLLGVASLQFVASFSNADALNRSQSVMVAQQLSERLRANALMSATSDGQVVANEYYDSDNYNFTTLSCTSGEQPFACYCEDHPASIPDCSQNQCSAAEFARFDAYQVSCSAVSHNPSMTIALLCDDNDQTDADSCSAGSRQQIMLSWPVVNWANQQRQLNAACNEEGQAAQDCVVLEVVL